MVRLHSALLATLLCHTGGVRLGEDIAVHEEPLGESTGCGGQQQPASVPEDNGYQEVDIDPAMVADQSPVVTDKAEDPVMKLYWEVTDLDNSVQGLEEDMKSYKEEKEKEKKGKKGGADKKEDDSSGDSDKETKDSKKKEDKGSLLEEAPRSDKDSALLEEDEEDDEESQPDAKSGKGKSKKKKKSAHKDPFDVSLAQSTEGEQAANSVADLAAVDSVLQLFDEAEPLDGKPHEEGDKKSASTAALAETKRTRDPFALDEEKDEKEEATGKPEGKKGTKDPMDLHKADKKDDKAEKN
eukprot:TRINITY_DN5129_c0_g1_i1.p1 TRINITY_DN5129_c0_g1~~TRINITY_DN5129_c0_g1_i1.p1  ORF type:complete len:297 (-),score=130.59 TRINITY_DN5129_c0_g1_i1:292-1182(-)